MFDDNGKNADSYEHSFMDQRTRKKFSSTIARSATYRRVAGVTRSPRSLLTFDGPLDDRFHVKVYDGVREIKFFSNFR